MKSFDFEEFKTEKDIEQAFDDMIRDLADEITLAEADPAIVNPVKVYQIKFVYEAMKYLTRGTDAKVTYDLHKPFKSMGNVSVESKTLTIRDSVWFNRAARFASNMEIYPLVNGKFRLTFTFHRLTSTLR